MKELQFCSRCAMIKDAADFARDARRKNGLQVACRKCHKRLYARYQASLLGREANRRSSRRWLEKQRGVPVRPRIRLVRPADLEADKAYLGPEAPA